MREREAIFSDYVSDLRRKEKEDKASQKEKVSLKCCKIRGYKQVSVECLVYDPTFRLGKLLLFILKIYRKKDGVL